MKKYFYKLAKKLLEEVALTVSSIPTFYKSVRIVGENYTYFINGLQIKVYFDSIVNLESKFPTGILLNDIYSYKVDIIIVNNIITDLQKIRKLL